MEMDFAILSAIRNVRNIARGRGIREVSRLRRTYGGKTGTWRKRKGLASIQLLDGTIWLAELHWYEAHGVGRKEVKIKDKLRKL
jgi:hypothetical protein